MAIKWLCTGVSQHGYQYKATEVDILNGSVLAVDFKAEVDIESEAGAVNELFDTKPVLTEAGIEAFVGLQVYPQGFTVYIDDRLTNLDATAVLDFAGVTIDAGVLATINVGAYLDTSGGTGGGGSAS